jgi:hypothetical protein
MMSQVIEQTDLSRELAATPGQLDATLGGVITNGSVINVVVTGNPAIIDLVIDERLAEGEGFGDTLRYIAEQGETFASIELDYAGAKGLMRLLNRAISLCEAHGLPAQDDEDDHATDELGQSGQEFSATS